MSDLAKESDQNFTWQWENANEDSSVKWSFSIEGITIISFGSDSYSVRSAVGVWCYGPPREKPELDAFTMLLAGQRHNPPVQQKYREFLGQIGADAFWQFVCASAWGRGADFNEARINISWQRDNNRTSLERARNECNNGAAPKSQQKALIQLIEGQRHNTEVMKLYRACYRDNASQLFGIVSEVLG